ncbi:MAG: hypothetical protein LBQ40_04540 [Clostridiales bacterium]|jgi:hypothetical protein|nr:hypothetical protein [Clostridiales bacterium]
MNALKKEINSYIDKIPESKLAALIPLLKALSDDNFIIETNLTKREIEVIKKGRAEFDKGNYITLNQIK